MRFNITGKVDTETKSFEVVNFTEITEAQPAPVPGPTPEVTPPAELPVVVDPPLDPPKPEPEPLPEMPKPEPEPERRLEFKPPTLTNPITLVLTKDNFNPIRDETKDYILVIKDGYIDIGTGTITIGKGKNEVLIGGQIHHNSKRPLNIKRVTGSEGGHIYVEGVRLSNVGGDAEGINHDVRTRGTKTTIQNVQIDKIHGTYAGHHADNFQSWGGNEDGEVILNRVYGDTNYQNLMLQPGSFGYGESKFVYRIHNSVFEHDGRGGIQVYAAGMTPATGKYKIDAKNVVLARPNYTVLESKVFTGLYHVIDKAGIKLAKRGETPFPHIGEPGRQYKSPGYVS